MPKGFNFCIKHISFLNLSKYHLADIWHSIREPRGEYKSAAPNANTPPWKKRATYCSLFLLKIFFFQIL